MPYRRVWVSCILLWDKLLSSIFLIFWKRVCLGMRKLVQWRKKCIANSIYLPNSSKGFKVPWKQCLNLCSWRWLWPRRSLVKSLIPTGLWISQILLVKGCMKFSSFFLKVLRLAKFLMLRLSLSFSDMAERKNEFLK